MSPFEGRVCRRQSEIGKRAGSPGRRQRLRELRSPVWFGRSKRHPQRLAHSLVRDGYGSQAVGSPGRACLLWGVGESLRQSSGETPRICAVNDCSAARNCPFPGSNLTRETFVTLSPSYEAAIIPPVGVVRCIPLHIAAAGLDKSLTCPFVSFTPDLKVKLPSLAGALRSARAAWLFTPVFLSNSAMSWKSSS